MSRNPFTPAFGGMPLHFFGRGSEIAYFEDALENEHSVHRAFFITGGRGSGKTTLLERMSQIARDAHWRTVDVHSANAAQDIVRQLKGAVQQTVDKRISPHAAGISIGEAATTATNTFDAGNLQEVIADACGALKGRHGIAITIDEIQKVPEPDAESICAAIQLCLRKGYPVALVLAGLSGSKQKVASYKGCTFMQRAPELVIGSLTISDTTDAFQKMFRMSPGVSVDDGAVWEMGQFSKGYPYLMQLTGYYVVDLFGAGPEVARVGCDQVRAVEPWAYEDFRANVIDPTLSPLGRGSMDYLRAVASVMDEDGASRTSLVAKALGKTAQECSSYRRRLIDKRIIVPDGYGVVRFGLPLLYRYFTEPRGAEGRLGSDDWRGR